MAQFDVYQHKEASSVYPLLVDIQHEVLETLSTRLVVPLTPCALYEGNPPQTMCPIIHLEQGAFIFMPQYMSSMSTQALGERVGSIGSFREEVVRAIDLLITGV
jgi:toxin CcdB